jgi:hypothetical protein
METEILNSDRTPIHAQQRQQGNPYLDQGLLTTQQDNDVFLQEQTAVLDRRYFSSG